MLPEVGHNAAADLSLGCLSSPAYRPWPAASGADHRGPCARRRLRWGSALRLWAVCRSWAVGTRKLPSRCSGAAATSGAVACSCRQALLQSSRWAFLVARCHQPARLARLHTRGDVPWHTLTSFPLILLPWTPKPCAVCPQPPRRALVASWQESPAGGEPDPTVSRCPSRLSVLHM